MFFLNREQTNPYFNLAAEEYLLRQGPGDMFMLWQNEPCVVIGKHQNAFAEINYRYCRDEKIPVIRRISGGGAVYHGPGNINFSFIKTVEKENAVDFSRFLKPMMETFARLGLAVTSGKRNDLYIHGLKFSGNAEHVYRDKVLHHGTILFDANLDVLNLALTPSGKIFTDKAVKSVRSKVTNLKPYLPDIETIDEFTTLLIQSAGQSIPELQPFSLSDSDIHNINSLATEKYSTWDWNFGYSPQYIFTVSLKVLGENREYNFTVKNGYIIDIQAHEALKSQKAFRLLQSCFAGRQFREETLLNIINDRYNELADAGFEPESLLSSLF